MIPDRHYRDFNAGNSYSFINKGVFSGIILFSELNGSFRDVYVYGGDLYPIIDADVVDSENVSSSGHYCFLSVVGQPLTKGGNDIPEDGIQLEPSICIADNENKFEGDFHWWNDYSEDAEDGGGGGSVDGTRPSEGDNYLGDNSSGGGSSSGNLSSGRDLSPSEGFIGDRIYGDIDDDIRDDEQGGVIRTDGPVIIHDKQKYSVMLYNSKGGITSGSGYYQAGTLILCTASPNNSFVFDRWVGDLYGEDDLVFFTVNSDINATAYFRMLLETGPARPCLDSLRGIMNPLMNMSLAPSNTWNKNNFKGATFGRTRYGKDKEGNTVSKSHNGIDLYAEPGTPIFSMFDGVVNSDIYITEQPMRSDTYKTKDKYPQGYIGDKNGSGNRIYIDSEINGDYCSIGYCHLLEDTPVAENPRTGQPFKPGDYVYQGEVIAYSGRTGNANNVPYAHLHLVVKKNNGFIDPEPYINGKLNTIGKDEDKVVSSINFTNIICH